MSGENSIFRDIAASPESAKEVVGSVIRIRSSASAVNQRFHLPFRPWWPLRSSGSTVTCLEGGERMERAESCLPFVRYSFPDLWTAPPLGHHGTPHLATDSFRHRTRPHNVRPRQRR